MKKEQTFFTRKRIIILIVIMFLAIVTGVSTFVVTYYRVTKVEVDGNIHYSEKEIEEMVLRGNILDNSLLLARQYKDKAIVGIPFIESMSVEVASHDKIVIQVYEKALAGCVAYLGKYMYFDREGIVVESADQVTEGVPQVTGLSFDEVVLHEPLPVEDTDVFADILSITQLLGKYDILADKIHFDRAYRVTLYYDEVRVDIGDRNYLDEKIMQLPEILPHLDGKKGVLRMQDFNGENETVTFEVEDMQ